LYFNPWIFTAHGFIHLILHIVLEKSGTRKDLKKTSAIPEKAVAKLAGRYYVFAKGATSLDASFYAVAIALKDVMEEIFFLKI
jgi:hypothetical protein